MDGIIVPAVVNGITPILTAHGIDDADVTMDLAGFIMQYYKMRSEPLSVEQVQAEVNYFGEHSDEIFTFAKSLGTTEALRAHIVENTD